ncbi:MAG TPA: circularly permuted type 2 ATP-grasp protein [Solirubrobacteraceae bacterium]|nr:circularly permuted type 2 ATP-grasp protein [Solirubrobacteraceae bacterium]
MTVAAEDPLDLLAGYATEPGRYDEAVTGAGLPRRPSLGALTAVGRRPVDELAAAVNADAARDGVCFHSVDGDQAFVIDPVPRVIGAGEWAPLEVGLAQRVHALNAFVADVYGPRRIVEAGVVPARVVDSAEYHEPGMHGLRPPGDIWIGLAGLDLVRDESGRFLVLEDNVRTPSGFAYACAARRALVPHLELAPADAPRPLDGLAGMLAAALRAAAPGGGDPHAVVLTDGDQNAAYWEHEWAAGALRVPLVEPGRLELRDLRLRLDGEPVDVVYRRTNADRLDTPVGELLLGPLRAGTLGVVNSFGTGVADDKLTHAYVEDMVRFYLGEEPLLASVETFDLGRPEILERALDVFDELVIKPRGGYGGIGIVIAPHAEPSDVDAARAAVRAHPTEFVAQRMVLLSSHPTVVDGRVAPRHVDLRPFVFLTSDNDVHVLPGGLTRVAFDEGALVVNSSQNGGAKDTWVLP